MDRLQRPAVCLQLPRQPVEQFRMRRPATSKSKVAGRIDESDAKMVVPQTIHDDSCGQRILW